MSNPADKPNSIVQAALSSKIMPQLNPSQIQQIVIVSVKDLLNVKAAKTKKMQGAVESSDSEYARMLAIMRYYTQQAQARASQAEASGFSNFLEGFPFYQQSIGRQE